MLMIGKLVIGKWLMAADSLLLIAQFYILESQLSFILYQTYSECSMKNELFKKIICRSY